MQVPAVKTAADVKEEPQPPEEVASKLDAADAAARPREDARESSIPSSPVQTPMTRSATLSNCCGP